MDVGTGSGALAIAIARRVPSAHVWATDDSESAVCLARINVTRHALNDRVHVLRGDLLAPVLGRVDLVVANLPYHAQARSATAVESAVRDQPEHAIYAPGDGLGIYRALISICKARLDAEGALAIQLYGQMLMAEHSELDHLVEEVERRGGRGVAAPRG